MPQCEWQTVRETTLGEPPDRGCGAEEQAVPVDATQGGVVPRVVPAADTRIAIAPIRRDPVNIETPYFIRAAFRHQFCR